MNSGHLHGCHFIGFLKATLLAKEKFSLIINQIDYSLGATKWRPNVMFQFFSKPSFDNIVSQKFIYEDLKEEPQFIQHGLKFVIISEKDSISERNKKVAKEADVEIIPFSQQSEILALK
ncbi:DUF1829 domain-containing protein [Aerococcus urinae]|uniref:DUF1829 domain-containing protein n=2 Tax=Aerococcus urinae TaxID=1376 RepID=A0A329NI47_9LACT|nr:DUF1829 domain-containing protein [Aerococcus urinae]QPS02332.1 DUF1829 domain-containing protein [Aerococcus urinae]RAV67897.1 hypothetical protein DBT42_02990 [Aerococcus urinae]